MKKQQSQHGVSGIGYRRLLCVLVLAVTPVGATQVAEVVEYFCPAVNATLFKQGSELVGRITSTPPASRQEALDAPRPSVALQLSDCSDSKYVCIEFADARLATAAPSSVLFAPKKIDGVREDAFRGARAISYYATSATSLRTAAQVTVWQPQPGVPPATFTIVPGRGVVYISGLRVASNDVHDLGTCVLQSERGLLAEVNVVHGGQKETRH